jgi:zinc protease
MLRKLIPVALIAVLAVVGVSCSGEQQTSSLIDTAVIESPESPLVAVRLMFKVGSIHDPQGKEGLAALTGLMVGQAGTQQRSFSELVDLLYPMAASIDVTTDREVTVISGEIHREKLDEFIALLQEAVLEPGFDESDFTRNREQLKTYLTTTLRASNDELLGLEALQQTLFDGHPYAHAPQGTVAGLTAITLDDVRQFHAQHFTQANLMLGVAGGFPEGFVDTLAEALSALPEGTLSTVELPEPAAIEGRNFTIVEKPTASVGIHFGFPLPVTRADEDYFPPSSTTTIRPSPTPRRPTFRGGNSTSPCGCDRWCPTPPTSPCETPSSRSSA